jgi:hypothetical protein
MPKDAPKFPQETSGAEVLSEPANEGQGRVRDLLPPVVDGQRVTAARDLGELRNTGVLLLARIRGAGEGGRDRVVLLAGHDQHRSPVGIARVDLVLGTRVEVRRGSLPERGAGGRDGERLEQAPGLVLVDGVGERVAELLVGQRDRAVPVVPIS